MPPLVVKMGPELRLSDAQLFDFCRANDGLQVERTARGEVVIMAPTGASTGRRNSALNAALYAWARREGSGISFDSSTGFVLPNRAMRSPDGCWVARSRLEGLSDDDWERFLPLCPDFVVELRSASDRLESLHEKLEEYLDNGARLGWLIDPVERRLHVYRPGAEPRCLENPVQVSGDPELPGFVLELGEIWSSS